MNSIPNLFLDHTLLCTIEQGVVRLRCLRTPSTAEHIEWVVEPMATSLRVVSTLIEPEASVDAAWQRLYDTLQEVPKGTLVTRPIVFEKEGATRLLHLPVGRVLIWQESGDLHDLRSALYSNRIAAMDAFHTHVSRLVDAGWTARVMPAWEEIAGAFRSIPNWKEMTEGARRFFIHADSGAEVGPEWYENPSASVRREYNLQLENQKFSSWFQENSEQKLVWSCGSNSIFFCDLNLRIAQHADWDGDGTIIVTDEGAWEWHKVEVWGILIESWLREGDADKPTYVCYDELYKVHPDRTEELHVHLADEWFFGHGEQAVAQRSLALVGNMERPELYLATLCNLQKRIVKRIDLLFVILQQAANQGIRFDVINKDGEQVLDSLAAAFASQIDTRNGPWISAKKRTILRCIEMVVDSGVDLNRRSGFWGIPVGVTVALALRESLSKGHILKTLHNSAMAYSDELLDRCDLSAPGIIERLAHVASVVPGQFHKLAMRCLVAGANPTEALGAGLATGDRELVCAALARGANPNAYSKRPDWSGTPVDPVFARLGKVMGQQWRELLEPAGLDTRRRGSSEVLTKIGEAEAPQPPPYEFYTVRTAFSALVWNSVRGFRASEALPSEWDAKTRTKVEKLVKKIDLNEAPGALFTVGKHVPLVSRQRPTRNDSRDRTERLRRAAEAAAFLVDRGADMVHRDAFRALCRIGSKDLVQRALLAGAHASDGVYDAAAQGHDDVLELLLSAGGSPHPLPIGDQIQLRSPVAACCTLRGYQLLRSHGAALGEEERGYLLSISHSFYDARPLSPESIKIAAAVLREDGYWRRRDSIDGRFLGLEGRVEAPEPIFEAAAALDQEQVKKPRSPATRVQVAPPVAVDAPTSHGATALVYEQGPFRGFVLCDSQCAPPSIAAGEYKAMVDERSVVLESVRSVMLTSDEVSRVQYLLGSRYEYISTAIFDSIKSFDGSQRPFSMGEPVGYVVIGSFSFGDDSFCVHTVDHFSVKDWSDLENAILKHLETGILAYEFCEFQGEQLVIDSGDRYQRSIKVHAVDALTLAALQKLFPSGYQGAILQEFAAEVL